MEHDDARALLIALYPHSRTEAVARLLRVSTCAVYRSAARLGLKKTPAYLRSPMAHRARPGCGTGGRSAETRFKPGQAPWNKGRSYHPGGRCAETQFKPGNRPHTWHPIGHERITDEGYLQRKMTDTGVTRRDYVNVHWLLWFEAGRTIPPNHVLIFRDGNRKKITLENLELVSRPELMRRNSVHNLPKPIAELVQLRGAINRKINRLEGKKP